jgi:heme-degrading monooxygenase HmoA
VHVLKEKSTQIERIRLSEIKDLISLYSTVQETFHLLTRDCPGEIMGTTMFMQKRVYMTHMIVRHKVKDYRKWKQAVYDHSDIRKAGGEKSFHVFRSAQAPNDLTILCEWESLAKARKFIQSKELREGMKQAGVIGKPQIYFFNQSESLDLA